MSTDTAISTEVIEGELIPADFNDAFDAVDAILDDSHIIYADEDDDPLADLDPGIKHIKANASDGFFWDGEQRVGETLDCIILDFTKPRQMFQPEKAGDPLWEQLQGLPKVKGPLCRTNHYERRSPDKSEPPRFHRELDEDDVAKLVALGAGDCNTCPLTKAKACHGGRKLLVYSPRWEEPVAFQVGLTSMSVIDTLFRQAFKYKGKSVDISLRPVRFGWKRETNDKGQVYYILTAVAGKPRPPREVAAYQALREVYRLRRPGHEEHAELGEMPAAELPPSQMASGDDSERLL